MNRHFHSFRVFSADEPAGGSLVSEAVADLEEGAPAASAEDWEDEGRADFESAFEPDSDSDSEAEVEAEAEVEPAPDAGGYQEQAVDDWSMNPRQQAYHEAQTLGRDSEWAENRAFDIYEERQALANLRNNAPVHVPMLAQQFEQSGLPAGAAAPYYDNLVKLTKQGYRHAAQDPAAQRVALANALGEYMIQEHLSGAGERRPVVTPTSGGSGAGHSSLARLTKTDQRFVSQWQATHNGGKPPTSKQLAALEAEGLIG